MGPICLDVFWPPIGRSLDLGTRPEYTCLVPSWMAMGVLNMRPIRLLLLTTAVILALAPTTALASTTYREAVSGFETGYPYNTSDCLPPNSVSPFAGVASGTLDGTFQIAVCHSPLDPDAEILGGSFVLTSGTTTVTGQFAPGGTVTLVNETVLDGSCTQTYSVSGRLLPGGKFSGTLTHYGYWTGLSCSIFFATISGRAQLKL